MTEVCVILFWNILEVTRHKILYFWVFWKFIISKMVIRVQFIFNRIELVIFKWVVFSAAFQKFWKKIALVRLKTFFDSNARFLDFVNIQYNLKWIKTMKKQSSACKDVAPFYGWGSTASRLVPPQGGSSLFTAEKLWFVSSFFHSLGSFNCTFKKKGIVVNTM